MESEFFKKKEELKNKIKDINTYWKKIELTYQIELKRRREENEKNEEEKRKENKKRMNIYIFLKVKYFFI